LFLDLVGGGPNILLKARAFVAAMQPRQGRQAACVEELADHVCCIRAEQLRAQALEKRKTTMASICQLLLKNW